MRLPQKRVSQLPNTTEDLSRFILVKEQELQAHVRLVRAHKKIADASDAHKAALIDAQNLGDLVVTAKAHLGELLAAMPKKYVGSTEGTHVKPGKGRAPKQEPSLPPGITKKESHQAQTIAKNMKQTEEILERIKAQGEIPTPNRIYAAIQRTKREEAKKNTVLVVKSDFEVLTEKDIDDTKKQIRKMGVARIEADRIPDAVQSIRLAFSDKEIKALINGLVGVLKTQPEDRGESS